MSRRKQAVVALVVVIVGLGGTMLIPGVRRLIVSSNNEKAFTLMNRDRVNNSPYPALAHQKQLQAYAQNWSNHMSSTGRLEHNSPETHICCWREIGENVGSGSTLEIIEKAFMDSKEHRDNILRRAYTQAGVGVAYNAKKHLFYVTQAFRQPDRSSVSAPRRRAQPAPHHRTVSPRPRIIPSRTPTPSLSRTPSASVIASPSPTIFTPPPVAPTTQPQVRRHSNLARVVFVIFILLGAGLALWFVTHNRKRGESK